MMVKKKKSVAKEVEEEGNTVEPEDDYFASDHLLFTKISAAFQAVFCPWEKVDFVFFRMLFLCAYLFVSTGLVTGLSLLLPLPTTIPYDYIALSLPCVCVGGGVRIPIVSVGQNQKPLFLKGDSLADT